MVYSKAEARLGQWPLCLECISGMSAISEWQRESADKQQSLGHLRHPYSDCITQSDNWLMESHEMPALSAKAIPCPRSDCNWIKTPCEYHVITMCCILTTYWHKSCASCFLRLLPAKWRAHCKDHCSFSMQILLPRSTANLAFKAPTGTWTAFTHNQDDH